MRWNEIVLPLLEYSGDELTDIQNVLEILNNDTRYNPDEAIARLKSILPSLPDEVKITESDILYRSAAIDPSDIVKVVQKSGIVSSKGREYTSWAESMKGAGHYMLDPSRPHILYKKRISGNDVAFAVKAALAYLRSKMRGGKAINKDEVIVSGGYNATSPLDRIALTVSGDYYPAEIGKLKIDPAIIDLKRMRQFEPNEWFDLIDE
jgi:hypothetical protein